MTDKNSESDTSGPMEAQKDWPQLYCNDCDAPVTVRVHPKGGTLLACDCAVLDRELQLTDIEEFLESLEWTYSSTLNWGFREHAQEE